MILVENSIIQKWRSIVKKISCCRLPPLILRSNNSIFIWAILLGLGRKIVGLLHWRFFALFVHTTTRSILQRNVADTTNQRMIVLSWFGHSLAWLSSSRSLVQWENHSMVIFLLLVVGRSLGREGRRKIVGTDTAHWALSRRLAAADRGRETHLHLCESWKVVSKSQK